MYNLLIFDLDGTLADTDLLVVDAYLKIFKKYRPDYKPTFKELTLLSGPTLYDMMKYYFPNEDTYKLIEEFKSYSKSMYYSHTSLYKGIKEFLLELKEEGFKLAILTNKMSTATQWTLQMYGVENVFDLVLCSDMIANPKPAGNGVIECINRLNSSRNDTLFIGDSLIDEQTAFNSSVDCCLVTWNIRGKLNNSNAKYYVNSLSELKEVILNGK